MFLVEIKDEERQYRNRFGLRYVTWMEAIRSSSHPDFLKRLILEWYRFIERYENDTDPKECFWGYSHIQEKELFPRMKSDFGDVIDALHYRDESVQSLFFVMLDIGNHFTSLIYQHYKKHEFGELPSVSLCDLTPRIPETIHVRLNEEFLLRMKEEGNLLAIGPLLLTWENNIWSTTLSYSVYISNGSFLLERKDVPRGLLRRFKDPVKRHVKAIEQVQDIARFVDWEKADTLLWKQKRTLLKMLREKQDEAWA